MSFEDIKMNYVSTTPVGTKKVWDDDNPQTNRFSTHKEAEQHYDAAKASVDQLWARLNAYQLKYGFNFDAPGLSEQKDKAINIGNGGHQLSFGPQSGGLLWKPEGNTGNPVLVMPKKYTAGGVDGGASFIAVDLYDADNKRIEPLKWSSSGNGGRGNHRAARSASYYRQYAPLVARWTFEGRPEFVVIPDPTKRYE